MKLMKNIILKPFGTKSPANVGMALPEVMISLFIVGSSLAGVAYKMGDVGDQQRLQESYMTLSQTAAALSASSVSLATLQRSAFSTDPLVTAFQTRGLGNCLQETGKCKTGIKPFHLHSATSQLAGEGNEMQVTFSGDQCLPAAPSGICAYQINASYDPICGVDKATGAMRTTCDVAESLIVTIEISPIDGDDKNGNPSYWMATNLPGPQSLSFTREVPVSMGAVLSNSLNDGQSLCDLDQPLNRGFQERRNRLNSLATQAGGGDTDKWDGTQYRKYLRGISWNGAPICQSTGLNIDGPVKGENGDRGQQGTERGIQGPPGRNASC